ncbi:hypothetical protein [Mycolicibacterium palauense]|uniref:hypothetical protein n=1 Tax=Mycolicibacterium palauense TaxID=2034511 RepID=UPI000BFF0065|nr:hypothetical protein [Mycolicibacterium palauense]
MRRWYATLLVLASALALGFGAPTPSAGAVDAPIGKLGDTLRVQDGDLIADVTVLSVEPSAIPPGWGYPPRWPRQQVWKAKVVVQAVRVPNPYAMTVSFWFRGVTPTGDAYEPRNTDAPDDLRLALQNAPQGSTVGGFVFWDCYRDLVSNVVLVDKKTGIRLAQWNL